MSREIEEREIDDAYDRGFEAGLAEAYRRVQEAEALLKDDVIITSREWTSLEIEALRKVSPWPIIQYRP